MTSQFSSHSRSTTRTSQSSSHFRSTTIHPVCIDGLTIETTVTSDAGCISQWIREIISLRQGRMIVGLDLEWKPNYQKFQNNKAATLQLCIDTKCLIVQFMYLDSIPKSLRDFLGATPGITFVGVGVANDVRKLQEDWGLSCLEVLDLRAAAASKNLAPGIGLKTMASALLGLHMDKPKNVTMSAWDKRVLGDLQVRYACIDAYVSYKLGHYLLRS